MEGGSEKIHAKESLTAEQQVEKVLDQIDFPELAAIYREIGSRSGVQPEDLAPLQREHIRLFTSKKLLPLLDHFIRGWCSSDGDITLQVRALQRRARGFGGLRSQIPLAAVVLKTLCHEEAHGSAFRGYNSEGNIVRMGMSIDSFDDHEEKWNTTFTLLNEAVTDIIGERAFKMYLDRRRLIDDNDSSREIIPSDWRDSYVLPRTIFRALVERIAREFEVPGDVVENAFVRAAYEGEDFESEDMRELFEQSVSSEFYKRIQTAAHIPVFAGAKPTLDLAKISYELKSYEWSQEIRAKWKKLLSLVRK